MNTAQASLIHCEPVSLTSRLAAVFGWRSRKRLLDVRDLPDHLKRDMGYLDGNDPCGRRR
ncbi:hypothetical protein [Aminobacter carboxidus]|uniref:DUF1127 domain-containing protein n=1 Tax=Aminobacter carboxidus TaxID=376165 RepID=A0ABR9GSE8_9HYPH|nr:hypothetical protein [Aminobacter carboxidus]MBE1206479.1 hypothetical protein [Aminobacter carboxidus]